MDLAWERHEAWKEGLETWKEGLEKGRKQGQVEGKLKIAVSVAKNLKSKGYSSSDIRNQLQDYFSDQLSPDEIEQIIAKL